VPRALLYLALAVLVGMGIFLAVELVRGRFEAGQGDTTILVAELPGVGDVLTDANGWTLYKVEGDVEGQSDCPEEDGCTKVWPPLIVVGTLQRAPEVAGQLTTRTRRDNTRQVVYNGWPLYRYSEDEAPGDSNGDRVRDEWGFWSAVSPEELPFDQ
jgi:predicted lipoprotein with Yx(FWY)xxD motif